MREQHPAPSPEDQAKRNAQKQALAGKAAELHSLIAALGPSPGITQALANINGALMLANKQIDG